MVQAGGYLLLVSSREWPQFPVRSGTDLARGLQEGLRTTKFCGLRLRTGPGTADPQSHKTRCPGPTPKRQSRGKLALKRRGQVMTGRLADPSEHTDKDVRKALRRWVDQGWALRHEGHGFRLYCPCENKCTTIPVPSTPRNSGNAARRLTSAAQQCPKDADDPRRSLTGMDR